MDWECEQCTFINTDTSVCECCRTQRVGERPNKRAKHSSHAAAQAEVLAIDSDSEGDDLNPSEPASGGDEQQQPEAAQNRAQHVRHAATSLYVLDNCSCHSTADSLTKHLRQHLQEKVLQTSSDLPAAVASLSCPKCSKHISSQDLYKLLGGSTLGEVYAAFTSALKQEYERLNPHVAEPKCSSCPDGTSILSASCLSPLISSSSSQQQQALPTKQVLHAALQARKLSKPRSAADSAAALAENLGPTCKYFCTGCTAAWGAPATAAADNSAAATADPATAAAVETALKLWRELVQLQQVTLEGAPAAAAAAAESAAAESAQSAGKRGTQQQDKNKSKNKGSSRSCRYQENSGKAWAAGTGYGGDCDRNANMQKAMSAAANRQQATDAALTDHLTNICNILTSKNSSSRPGAGFSSRAAAAGGSAIGIGVLGCAVLLGGPLAWLLRLLFSNDSLMDVGGRQGLYRQGMALLRLIGSSPDLLPLLQLPADDPRDSGNNTAAANPSSGTSSSSCTLMSALLRLQQQANLFRKSAADLMADEDDEDATAAVCLALDISSLVQDISEANSMFAATMVAEKGALQLQPVSAAAGDKGRKPPAAAAGNAAATAAPGDAAAANGGWVSSIRQRLVGAVAGGNSNGGGAAAADAASAVAAAKAQYVAALRPYQFIEADLLKRGSYYFRTVAEKQQAAGGEVMRKRLRRITEELGSLSTSLPLTPDSSILVACDSERMDVLRALLLPHIDTPYGGGAFLFDILLPEDYPSKPPKVQFLTTGGGRVRFNPNLYNCGKVCLSLLGTWSGPSWEPGVSTLLQVLVSLQSMVFVSDPYFNEPGFERSANTASGRQESTKYNQDLRVHTARHAILGALQNPDPVFKAALQLHYALRGPAVLAMLQQWVEQSGKQKGELKGLASQIKAELAKLPKPAGAAAAAGGPVQQSVEEQQQQHQRPTKRRAGATQSVAAAVHDEDGVIDLT